MDRRPMDTTVACPTCGAPAGKRCVATTGKNRGGQKTGTSHDLRGAAYRVALRVAGEENDNLNAFVERTMPRDA